MSAADRLRESLTAIVDFLVSATAYHAAYGATVVSQNADGTLELRADTDRIKLPGGVPIRGLPGVSVTVAQGAHVLVGFENGDPQKPRATLFDPTSLTSLTVSASTRVVINAPIVQLASGAQMPIARAGDIVQVALDSVAAAQIGVATGGVCVVSPLTPVILTGQILTGSTEASSA